MVTTRSRAPPLPPPTKPERLSGRREGQKPSSSTPPLPQTPSVCSSAASACSERYEKFRDERIKENLERMQKLGILDLSLQLKSHTPSASPSNHHRRKRTTATAANKTDFRPRPPPRRSSRLQNVTPVSYAEFCGRKDENLVKHISVLIGEGTKEEIYSDEHEKLLGSCETVWTLFVDGYGKDGRRIYDQIKGKTCHQCRQKTLGHRTHCSKCNLVQGQFCGDCLYMRYGENVLEANKNPNWICPVCRGICNCSLCRIKKGWVPTGPLYKKVVHLGYKSVAHYLVQTLRSQANSRDSNSIGAATLKKSLAFTAEESSCHEDSLEIEGGIILDTNGNKGNSLNENTVSDIADESTRKTRSRINKGNKKSAANIKPVTKWKSLPFTAAEDSSGPKLCLEVEGGRSLDSIKNNGNHFNVNNVDNIFEERTRMTRSRSKKVKEEATENLKLVTAKKSLTFTALEDSSCSNLDVDGSMISDIIENNRNQFTENIIKNVAEESTRKSMKEKEAAATIASSSDSIAGRLRKRQKL